MYGYLGLDTSNYTTSVSLYLENGKVFQKKKLLPVKEGSLGLRQSDAVFHHTNALHLLVNELFLEVGEKITIKAIGVSSRPRDMENSYMPCFTVGINVAYCLSAVLGVPVYNFSHQSGHIMSALYSCNKLNMINENFIAFHVSGGTTEAVMVKGDSEKIITEEIIAQSSDLKAGQAIDRVGQMLGLPFPSGKYIDKLASDYGQNIKTKVSMKGLDCSLSGIENICRKLKVNGQIDEFIARTCIEMVYSAIDKMTLGIRNEYGNLPIVYAGGVMSNSIISKKITAKYKDTYFCEPIYSTDNAVGISILAKIKCDRVREDS